MDDSKNERDDSDSEPRSASSSIEDPDVDDSSSDHEKQKVERREESKTNGDVGSDDSDNSSMAKVPTKHKSNGRKFSTDSDDDSRDSIVGTNHITLNLSDNKFCESLEDFKRAITRQQKERLRIIVSNWFDHNDWKSQSILFLYLTINYYENEIFRFIMRNIDYSLQQTEPELYSLIRRDDAYEVLSDQTTRERFILNNKAFAISVLLNTSFLSEQILTNSQIILSTELMIKMIEQDQRDLVKY